MGTRSNWKNNLDCKDCRSKLLIFGKMPNSKKSELATSKNNFGEKNRNVNSPTAWRNLTAFWILGLCNNFGYVVMLSAAHDILNPVEAGQKEHAPINGTRTCNTVSTGAILLADILPSVAIKFTAPFLPFYVHTRMAAVVVFSAAGFLFVSMSSVTWLAYTGVILTSLSSGLGEVTMLSYSHRFTKNVISTWSSGTGGAGIVGALSYAGLKLFLSSKETLSMMLVVPIIQAVTFWLFLCHPSPETLTTIIVDGVGSQEQMIKAPKISFKRKLSLLPGLLKYMMPLALVYFFEYFINQGLYELVEFRDIFLPHDDQYRWLQVDYQIGVFLSRSSVNFVTINNLWLMSFLQFINVFIILFEVLYFYVPTIWIIFALVLWEGLLGGAAYVNTFYKMSKEIPWEEREAALGIASMSDSFGIALAGWASMPIHNYICQLPLPHRFGN